MKDVEITIDGTKKSVLGIYYISNNNCYFLYTENKIDENGYIILNIVKVLQEVVNTPNGQSPTGNLVGLTISDENEWKATQKDISNIIADKQNHKNDAVRYLDLSLLKNLNVKSNRIFRLKEDMYNKTFKNNKKNDDSLILDYKNRYYEETEKNRKLTEEIETLNNKLNQIKNIIG